ncbi:hypothetical protein pb186bvf_000822 [Paramecium bursaria]
MHTDNQSINSNSTSINQLLNGIKKKIHKIKTQQEKQQHSIKLCPFPPNALESSQTIQKITIKIPLTHLQTKETFLLETLLWDIEDNYSEEELLKHLFVIVVDLLQDKYPNQTTKLTATQTLEIIHSCINQVKVAVQQIKDLQKYEAEIIEFEQCVQNNDSLIMISVQYDKIKESIQWDLNNQFSFIDQFASTFCYENKINLSHSIFIANQIRDQIQKKLDQRLIKIQKLSEKHNSKDFKNQILKMLDIPTFEPYQTIKEGPVVSELVSFLKKNQDFLPPELQYYYGSKPLPKQQLEAIVDQDDVKKVDGEFEIESKYMDPTIMADVILKKQQQQST